MKGVDLLKKIINSKQTLVLFANCSVSYNGRAKSFLGKGDRLIIIKSDSTILIHQPVGNNPINYMKQDTQFEIKGSTLYAYNSKEYLDIELHEIYSILNKELKDPQKLELHGTEKHMSDMIYDNPNCIEKGFKPLSREEHTKYGFIDVFGHDSNNNLTVIECKRFTATLDAVTQLRRYVEKIGSLKGVKGVRGIMAAPNISPNAKQMLEDYGYEYRKVDPPEHYGKHRRDQVSLDSF
ncbi:MAG: endonuclease NucS [archaeon]